jgi:type IV pilus assembly protein PilN
MVRINLLPVRETLRKRQLKQFALIAGAIVAATALIMVGTYLILSGKISSLQGQLAAHQAKLNDLKKKNQEINELKKKVAEKEKQVKTINDLTKKRDTPDPFMWGVARAIPDSVWLKSMNKTGGAFQLEGVGTDNTVVVEFVERLQKIAKNGTDEAPFRDPKRKDDPPLFNNVKLIQTVRGGGGKGSANEMSFSVRGNVQQ